jgi:DNA replication ATP-dependent helicase Dna2
MELLQNLSQAIDIQQERQDKDFKETMAKPLAERVAKGHTLTNLTIDKIDFYDGLPNSFCPYIGEGNRFIERIYFHCENNCSKFREGSSVVLTNGNISFKMEIESDGVDDFVLHSNDFDVKDNYISINNWPKSGWELNGVNLNITQRLLRASWQRLNDNPALRKYMEEMLNGQLQNHYDSVDYSPSSDDSQNYAIQKAIGCSSFCLIQGPPGTGKTYTIAKLCKKLVESGNKIFITGPTHTAINNCLIALSHELEDKSKVVKIGEKYQAAEILDNANITRKTRLKYVSYVADSNFSQSGFAIGATPFALCYPASKKMEGWKFDYIIMDEAAQLSMPLALAAMMYGQKLVFVGDHMQLDPIIPKNTNNWLFGCSVFKKMVDLYSNQVALLNQSYRLNEELIRIPNQLFYSGKISSKCSTNKEYKYFNCKLYPNIINHPSNEILIIHHNFDGLSRSPYEADMIADIVKDLASNGVKIENIGIMSPYRAQIREIKRSLIERNVLATEQLANLFIDTVDRMQGQEKDYILFSLANCNPLESVDRLDFFYSPNRLNVAITRAQVKCITIAHEKIFSICKESIGKSSIAKELEEGMRTFDNFYRLSTIIEMTEDDSQW